MGFFSPTRKEGRSVPAQGELSIEFKKACLVIFSKFLDGATTFDVPIKDSRGYSGGDAALSRCGRLLTSAVDFVDGTLA